ncbi:MAG: carbonic anhydrase [Pirellulaceae bacterium]|nr:carbonic anhydrase [Pirellulaceae bacterium]
MQADFPTPETSIPIEQHTHSERSPDHRQGVADNRPRRIHRRGILGAGVLAAGGGFFAGNGVCAENSLSSDASPAEVLEYLYAGNERFANAQPLAKDRSIQRVREVANEQKPFAAFLGCADSRVPIEIVFDQGFGDLFVTRIAGNIASSENIGSLEFGTLILGAKVLFVLGHSNCGAVAATIKADEVPGQISGLFQHIRPAAKESRGMLDKAVALNVRNQAITLAESSPVIAKLVRDKKLVIAGGVYDLSTGKVARVEIPTIES